MSKRVSLVLAFLLSAAGVVVTGQEAFAEEIKPEPRLVADAQTAQTQSGFDRRAGTQAGRPPTREEYERALADEMGSIPISRKARFVGPRDEPGTAEPPLPELYPFEVNRRIYPDPNNITVELAIANSSGVHWKTAYITLRSPILRKGQLFEINDWKIDEVIGLDYTFPRAEVLDRMKGLRVVSVSGERRESALAGRIEEDRLKAIRASGGGGTQQRRAGDQLAAPGLLSVMGEFQEPYTGIGIVRSEMRSPERTVVSILVPDDAHVPDALVIPLRETSDARQQIIRLANEFHDAARAVQDDVRKLTEALNGKPYRDGMAGDGTAALESLRANLKSFNSKGRQLALQIQRSNDDEIRRTSGIVGEYSQKIVQQLDAVEYAVRAHDSTFRVQM